MTHAFLNVLCFISTGTDPLLTDCVSKGYNPPPAGGVFSSVREEGKLTGTEPLLLDKLCNYNISGNTIHGVIKQLKHMNEKRRWIQQKGL